MTKIREIKSVRAREEEKGKMKKQPGYFMLTLKISILVGIILPLALGVKDLTLIAITFCFIWFLYAFPLLISTLLIKPDLRIR